MAAEEVEHTYQVSVHLDAARYAIVLYIRCYNGVVSLTQRNSVLPCCISATL